MRKHFAASWFLCRLLPTQHAYAVLGDLLELAGDDRARFRMLLLETAWSLLSRSIAGFLLAAVVGGIGMVGLQSAFFDSFALHAGTYSQRAWGSTLAALAGCLFTMACFSVVRYGARDRMTWLASAFIPPLVAAALFWWVPGVPAAAEMLLLALLLGGLLWRGSRRAMLTVVALLAMQFVLWFGGIGILLAPLARLFRYAPAAAMKPFALTAFAASYAGLMLLACISYTKVRRWLCV